MADIDLLPPRGVPRMALIGANGIAIGGTSTVAQLAAKGMQSICQVGPNGIASSDGASTVAQLAAMGIRTFAAVDENGVSSDDSVTTAATLQMRGLRPMVTLNASGVSATGTANILTLAQRGLGYFCPLDETGTATTLVDPTPLILRALTGTYQLTGEGMTPLTELVMQADNSGVTNKFVLAGQSADLQAPVPAEDPATTAWAQAVVTAGGTVSTTQRGYVDTLITAYKAAGVWTLLDREWLFAAENVKCSTIDIKGLASWTEPAGALLFTPGRGYKDDGHGGYFDLGVAPSGGVNFQQNTASFGAYVLTSRTSDLANSNMGSVNAGAGSYCFFRSRNGGGLEHDLNSSNFNSPANANAMGNYNIVRTNATTITPYKNNAAMPTGTTAAALALPAFNWFAFCHNSGSPSPTTTDEMASVFIGGAMTGTQALAKNAALNAYMTSQGCNVY